MKQEEKWNRRSFVPKIFGYRNETAGTKLGGIGQGLKKARLYWGILGFQIAGRPKKGRERNAIFWASFPGRKGGQNGQNFRMGPWFRFWDLNPELTTKYTKHTNG
jgi:hypothetical protein